MNKRILGIELKKQLEKGCDIIRISRWAFKIYSENLRDLDPYVQEILERLFSMEEDPQFEYTEQELKRLAEKLIEEGEKEELELADFSVAHKALILNETWLMCPLCQEAWESSSTYRMVICPKCKEKLHNPNYKQANKKLYPCPCCSFLTLSENPPGTFEICPVCNWEDDDVQFNNPCFRGGANENCLLEARENYRKFGASSGKYLSVVRNPRPEEIPIEEHPEENFKLEKNYCFAESSAHALDKETAIILNSNLFSCPNCSQTWESTSQEAKVTCPKCSKALKNPRHPSKTDSTI